MEEESVKDEQQISRAKARKLLQKFDFSKLYTKKRASSKGIPAQKSISDDPK